MNHNAFILILSSPSGAGKTTLSKALLANDSDIKMSISYTTRPKRNSEIDGKDYYFISISEFEDLISQGKFLEYAKVFGNYYGTPKSYVSSLLQSGKDVLFDIDWQGAEKIRKIMPMNVVSLFILPPSMEELELRLKKRSTDKEDVIKIRIAQAKSDISKWENYDYIVVNHKIENSLSLIESILDVERLKRTDFKKIVKGLLL